MSCSICDLRKEKRFCLAVHGRICPQCCGEQREVTLECPSECPYLQQARLHEKGRDLTEAPPEEMFPAVRLKEEFLEQHEPLIAGLLATLAKAARADRFLNDRQLIGGLANMARSRQTLIASGLVYEETLQNPAQQALVSTLGHLLEEFRDVEKQHLGYARLKDGDIFYALVFALRLAHVHTSGRPLSRAFVDFLQERFPQGGDGTHNAGDRGSRIIIP